VGLGPGCQRDLRDPNGAGRGSHGDGHEVGWFGRAGGIVMGEG